MSEENIEIVRQMYEKWYAGLEHGDPGAVFDLESVADDSEFTFEFTPPEGVEQTEGHGVWRGRDGYLQWFRAWAGAFEGWSLQVERLIDAGDDRVVALTHQSGTGKMIGMPLEMDVGTIIELEDGRIVRMRNYLTFAEALEAAGLSE